MSRLCVSAFAHLAGLRLGRWLTRVAAAAATRTLCLSIPMLPQDLRQFTAIACLVRLITLGFKVAVLCESSLAMPYAALQLALVSSADKLSRYESEKALTF